MIAAGRFGCRRPAAVLAVALVWVLLPRLPGSDARGDELRCDPPEPRGVDDSARPVRLTTDGRLKRDPIFTPDGRHIVYAGQSDGPQWVLFRLDLSSGERTRVHPDALLPEFRPTFSADGNVRAFLQMTGNDRLRFQVEWLAPPRTKPVPASKAVVWHGSLAPDGKHVVYAAAGHIYSCALDDGTERQLTRAAGHHNWPVFSPDGKRIAFASSRDGDYEIYSIARDGSDLRRLTHHRGLDMRPAWSANGKWLAFTTARHGDYELYRMRADGSRLERVTAHSERDDYAAWHPDGTSLVWVGERGGRFDLFSVRLP